MGEDSVDITQKPEEEKTDVIIQADDAAKVDVGEKYMIVSALANNMVIDVSGGVGSAKNGTNIQLWESNNTEAQIWELTYDKDDGTYSIVNPSTKKSLDVLNASSKNGTNVQLWEVHDSCAQKWKLIEKDGLYIIKSACSDKVLDVTNAGTSNGTNIQLWMQNGNTAQKWRIK